MACEAGASRPSVLRGRGLKVSVTALSRAWRRVPAPLRVLVRLTVLLLAVSLVTFALVSASPIDPVQANVGQTAYLTMSPERRAALAERWGAGEGVLERWAAWLVDALHGDLGYSLRFNAPVVDVVAERLAGSALLLATAWLLSGALGLALGVLAGARRGSRLDRIVCGWCYLLSATPTFWLAMLALMAFSVWLGWFPVGFASAIGGTGAVSFAERLHHAALPLGGGDKGSGHVSPLLSAAGSGRWRPPRTGQSGG